MLKTIRWRSLASVFALAAFVGSLVLYAVAPVSDFSRVLDMGVAPAFFEPYNPYPITEILMERTVHIPAAETQTEIVFASDIATIEVSAEQYAQFLEARPAGGANLPAFGDLGLQYPGQTVIAERDHGESAWLVQQLLDSGRATVIDERFGVQAEVIVVRETAYVCGPLCGEIEFSAEFLDGTVFFRVRVGVF